MSPPKNWHYTDPTIAEVETKRRSDEIGLLAACWSALAADHAQGRERALLRELMRRCSANLELASLTALSKRTNGDKLP